MPRKLAAQGDQLQSNGSDLGGLSAVHRNTKPSVRAQRTSRIRQAIEQVHQESNQIYGSYKIAEKLRQDASLEYACRNTVAQAMKEMGLKSKVAKKFKPNTTVADPKKPPAPNHLSHVFVASKPNEKWVTDITYLETAAGWV